MFYAYITDKGQGVVANWDECSEHVKGVSGALYKKFANRTDAEAYVKKHLSNDAQSYVQHDAQSYVQHDAQSYVQHDAQSYVQHDAQSYVQHDAQVGIDNSVVILSPRMIRKEGITFEFGGDMKPFCNANVSNRIDHILFTDGSLGKYNGYGVHTPYSKNMDKWGYIIDALPLDSYFCEVMAIYCAIRSFGNNILIVTDNAACCKVATGSKAECYANIWNDIFKLTNGKNISIAWIRAHAGNQWNERADELAGLGAAGYTNMSIDEIHNITTRNSPTIVTSVDSNTLINTMFKH